MRDLIEVTTQLCRQAFLAHHPDHHHHPRSTCEHVTPATLLAAAEKEIYDIS
jgi:hypothetical protein